MERSRHADGRGNRQIEALSAALAQPIQADVRADGIATTPIGMFGSRSDKQ
jgi:hypothetical protein